MGPKLAIPIGYDGYFEILSEDGRTVKCIENVPTLHSANHVVWKGYFFEISMPSVIGLQLNKNKMPLNRGSLVLNLCKNSFLNPLAFIVLALWPSKVAK